MNNQCKRLTPAREGLSFLVFPASKLNTTNSRIRAAVLFGLRNSEDSQPKAAPCHRERFHEILA